MPLGHFLYDGGSPNLAHALDEHDLSVPISQISCRNLFMSQKQDLSGRLLRALFESTLCTYLAPRPLDLPLSAGCVCSVGNPLLL